MAESGGPTTQSGIHFQNAYGTLRLARMLDPRDRSPAVRIAQVRTEAPQNVDDTVLTFADKHVAYVQLKEAVTSSSDAWRKMWADFEAQRERATFQANDRLVLVLGEHNLLFEDLRDAAERTGGAETEVEWIERLTARSLRLVDNIAALMPDGRQDHRGVWPLFEVLEVEHFPVHRVKEDLPNWLPPSSAAPDTLYSVLYAHLGGKARIRATHTAEHLRQILHTDHGIQILGAGVEKMGASAAPPVLIDLDVLQSQLKALLEAERHSSRETPAPEDGYVESLERIHQSLLDGGLSGARRKLTTLSEDAALGRMSPVTRARYLRLWGALELREGEPASAARRFVDAFSFDSEGAAALACRGFAALVQDDPTLALELLERSLALDPTREDAQANRISALAQLGRTEDLDQARATLSASELEAALALVRIDLHQHRFKEARGALERVGSGPHRNDGRLWVARAMAAVLPVQADLNDGALTPREAAARADVVEALTFVERALDAFGNDPMQANAVVEALRLRQAVLSWQGDVDGVLRTTQEALRFAPQDEGLWYNQLLALLNAERFPDLWHAYGQIPERVRNDAMRVMALEAASALERWDDVLTLAANLLAASLKASERAEVLLRRTQALLALNRAGDAQQLLAGEDQTSWQVRVAVAEIAVDQQDLEAADRAFEQAFQAAPESLQPKVVFRWARTVAPTDDFGRQVEIFERVLTCRLGEKELELVVRALFHAGRTGDLRAVVSRAVQAGGPLPLEVRHMHAVVANNEGDLNLAVTELAALALEAPQHPGVALHHAHTLLLLGRRREAAAELLRFSSLNPGEGALLLDGARAATRAGEDQLALDLAYQARRVDYDDQEMHLAYAMLAMNLTHEADRPIVEAECAVQLHGDDGKDQWIVLTSDVAPRRERREYALDGELAAVLIGRQLGETIKVREGIGGTVTVQMIVTKYAYAEIHFWREFHDLFPENHTILRFEVPGEGVSAGLMPPPLLDLMDRNQARLAGQAAARQNILESGLPHIANAVLNDETAVEFWQREITGGPGFVSFVENLEDRSEAQVAAQGGGVVVDVSVLLGLAAAGLLERLVTWLGPPWVTRHVAMELRASSHPLAQAATAFVEKHCTLVAAPKLHDVAQGPWTEVVPVTTRSAVMAAVERNAGLLTDDAAFRQANRSGHYGPVVQSFGTVDLLLARHTDGLMSESDVTQVLPGLLLANHALVPVTAALIELVIGQSAGRPGPTVMALIRAVTHERVLPTVRARWAAMLLRTVWLSLSLSSERQGIVRAVMERLRLVSTDQADLQFLPLALEHEFRLMPTQLKEVLAVIQTA